MCDDHGEVSPEYALVLSGILDDGTENVRAVFFREAAERMFGKPTQELRDASQSADDSSVIFEDMPSIGSEFIFTGRAKSNSFTESLEFIVNSIEDIDVVKEAQDLAVQLAS